VALLTAPSPLAKAVPVVQQTVLMVASLLVSLLQSPVSVEADREKLKDAGNWPPSGGVHVTVTSPEVLTAGANKTHKAAGAVQRLC
jgi:hypothetical protein